MGRSVYTIIGWYTFELLMRRGYKHLVMRFVHILPLEGEKTLNNFAGFLFSITTVPYNLRSTPSARKFEPTLRGATRP